MIYNLEFTETAVQNLRDISFNILEYPKNTNSAVDFVKGIQEQCEILKIYPKSGSMPKDRVLLVSGYRFLVYKEYVIFYLYDDIKKTSYIVSINNTKLDYMKLMKKIL